MTSLKKKISIELYRFIFMLFIVFWHFRGTLYFQKGYLAVEFYFILSGYLLYQSFLRSGQLSAVKYTFKKIKRFFPEYFLALILSTALDLFSRYKNGLDLGYGKLFLRFLSELTFTQNIGLIDGGGANYPCWYLSVLIYGGLILWAILRIADSKIHFSVAVILSYSLYALIYSKDNSFEQWDMFYPLLRGLAGLSLGVAAAKFMPVVNKRLQRFSARGIVLEMCLFLISIVAIVSGKISDIYVPIVFALLIICAFANNWSDGVNEIIGRCVTLLGGCTFGMLVFHSSISYCCTSAEKLLNIPFSVTNAIYMVLLLLVSITVKKLVVFVRNE